MGARWPAKGVFGAAGTEEGAGGGFDQVTGPGRLAVRTSTQRNRGLIESGSGTNDDLGLSRRRFWRLGCRLFARTARQGQVALDARLENEIHGRVPVIFSPSLYNADCLLAQRWPEVLPLKIVS